MKKRSFFNMYLTTTISVALVLCLVGLEFILVLSARNMITQLRENLALTIVMPQDADSVMVDRLGQYLNVASYANTYQYVSKDMALEEHIQSLGEDPTKFLGYNPLSDSYELYLKEAYTHTDSIAWIAERLQNLPMVDEVIYQQDVVQLLDSNLDEVSLFLLIIGVVLLLMAVALIVNTIRLYIYSKRFLINTMRLVGATPWVIKAPIVRRNLLMGFEAGLLALVALAGTVYFCKQRLGIWLFDINMWNILMVVAFVLIVGELIAFIASIFATNKYIRMKIDKMYEI